MIKSVCIVCLKTIQKVGGQPPQVERCGVPLMTKFVKFVENYLQISSSPAMQQLLTISSESETDGFCEKCELAVINPICKVYLELLSAQLRLSWELERLGKLLENSQRAHHEETIIKTVAGQVNVAQLEEFRKLLLQKCDLKRNEAMPNIRVMSRCDGERVASLEDLVPVDLDHKRLPDPLDIQSRLESREEEKNKIKTEVVQVIKTEPDTLAHHDPELSFENEDADFPTTSNSSRLSSKTQAKGKSFMTKSNNSNWKCTKCDKKFHYEYRLKTHFQYHHQLISCNICGKTTLGKQYLHKHFMLYHHKVGSYPCPTCSKVFDTREQMLVHRRKYHKVKHECPDCNVSFASKSNLEVHVAAHSQTVP